MQRRLGAIPEAAELVKAGFVVALTVFWSFPACFGRAAPAAGVQVCCGLRAVNGRIIDQSKRQLASPRNIEQVGMLLGSATDHRSSGL
jgi:hypothetical protein